MPLQHIDPMMIVKNVKRTADWYQDVLGFKVEMLMPEQGKPSFARLARDETATMFTGGSDVMTGKAAPKSMVEAVGTRNAQKVVSLYIRTNNLRTEFNRAKRKGAKITLEPVTQPYGMREFWMRDPNGYDVVVGAEVGGRR